MAKHVFRLVLPERRVVNAAVARFDLRSAREVRRMAQRARLFAALVELPARRREELGESVRLIAEAFLETYGGAGVTFGLARRHGHRVVEVTFSPPTDGQSSARSAAPSSQLPDAKTSAARGMLDEFELVHGPDGRPSVRLAQALAPAIRAPSESEVAVWSELLQAPSAEEALVVVHRWSRSLCVELGQIRSREPESPVAEEATGAENLAMLSLVISKTKNGIAILDADGSILWVNEAFVRMTGYNPHEAVGKRFDELVFGPSTTPAVGRSFEQALAHGHEWSEDVLQYRKDGRTFWAECSLTPVYNADGELKRWVLINTDVTRRRQEEESLRKAKEAAEASSRAKSEFLANISHEIRTPMNAILGMTELALATELTPEQREYLTVVHDSARSLLQFLNDVLDLSKIESGKLQLEQIEFNLADVVRETIRALAVKAHAKNLPIEISAPLDLPDIVQGDPVRVRQIVFNLLDNAIKFTERGSIRVVLEEQWRTDDEVGIHLAVEDTGVGIPPDRLERIFESFTQADASTTRKFGGTGLGLTITAELVQMMDGRIWVQSSEGQGSTFHVTLRFPLASPEPLRQRIAEQMRQVLANKSAFIVTRDATTRRVLHDWLKTWGCRASDASSLDAVRQDDANNVELVLVEIADVHQAQRLVEMAASLQEKIPHVVAIFEVDAPEVTHQCHQTGITCLIKPVSQQALADAILARLNEPSAVSVEVEGGVETTPESDRPTDDGQHRSTQPSRAVPPLSVLIVDDHDANRVLARRILERHGHQCVESSSGADALQKWRSQPFDVVVLDVQMPEMDGFDVLRKMREEERGSSHHTPVVTLTAHAMAGDRERCLAAGADAYLAKPLDASELLATVERLASRAPATEYPAAPAAELDQVDFTQALERMDGDEELLAEQMKFFLNDGPELLDQIQKAIDEPNPRQLELAAHRLKGLVAAYDAKRAADTALKLEEMGRAGLVTNEAGNLLAELRPAVEQLTQAMRGWMAGRHL